jgi:hypothetical protein
MFFGKGRKPLLDFLRNLTPQIVMLAIALVASSKLEFYTLDLSFEGVRRTLPFAMCMFVFFASLIANLTTFFEESLSEFKTHKTVSTNTAEQAKGIRRFRALLADAWSTHKLAVVRLFFVMVVAESAISVVFVMGIQSAASSPFLNK